MAFVEPLASFFTDFAVAALYNGASVQGIFDKPDSEHALGVIGFEAAVPRYVMRDSDLPNGYASGDSLVVQGVTYTVQAFQHDGTGTVTLVLRAS